MEMICFMSCYWQQDKKNKTKKCVNKNMSTDIKLSKAQFLK